MRARARWGRGCRPGTGLWLRGLPVQSRLVAQAALDVGSSHLVVGRSEKPFRHTRSGAAACSCGSSYTRKPFSSRPLRCC
jgi:hypothetical protein